MRIGERAAHFVEFLFVVNHVGARVTGNRKHVLQPDGFLGANLLAESAINAAEHVDFKFARGFLDVRVGRVGGDFAGRDADGLGRTDKFAELAGDAFFASVGVAHERGRAAVAGEKLGAFLGVIYGERLGDDVLQRRLHAREYLRDISALGKGEWLAWDLDYRHRKKVFWFYVILKHWRRKVFAK